MEPMRRELIWIERHNFHGWACSECGWVFRPLGSLVDESIHDMKRHYEEQRDKEFKSHVCAEHPRATKNPP
jgi:rubredoxin